MSRYINRINSGIHAPDWMIGWACFSKCHHNAWNRLKLKSADRVRMVYVYSYANSKLWQKLQGKRSDLVIITWHYKCTGTRINFSNLLTLAWPFGTTNWYKLQPSCAVGPHHPPCQSPCHLRRHHQGRSLQDWSNHWESRHRQLRTSGALLKPNTKWSPVVTFGAISPSLGHAS